MELEIKEVDVEKTKKIVGVQLPLPVYYRLQEEAEKEFMTISAYVRKLIMLHTNAYKNKRTNKNTD